MRSVSYRLADLNRVTVPLGFRGENEHTRVIIDCKKAFDEYPDAIPSLAVSPPNGTAYPAVIVRDGDLVYWDVRDSDLAKEGRGTAQLTFTENGVVRKDDIFNTVIGKSILPAGPAPDPIADWITEANRAIGTIEGAIETAQEAAEDAEAAKADAVAAKEAAEQAAGAAAHAPEIRDGYWYVWDEEIKQYVSTGINAHGEPGAPGRDATPALITVGYEDLSFPIEKGKLCYHSGLLYKAKQDIPTEEEWNAEHWEETTIEEEIGNEQGDLQLSIVNGKICITYEEVMA